MGGENEQFGIPQPGLGYEIWDSKHQEKLRSSDFGELQC